MDLAVFFYNMLQLVALGAGAFMAALLFEKLIRKNKKMEVKKDGNNKL